MPTNKFYKTAQGRKFTKLLKKEVQFPTESGVWIRHNARSGSWRIIKVEVIDENTIKIMTKEKEKLKSYLLHRDGLHPDLTYTGWFKNCVFAAEYRKAFQPTADVARSLSRSLERGS